MKKTFWAPITLGLAAYLLLPLPGLSAPLSERIEETRSAVQSKKYKEHVLSETIATYNVRIDALQGDINVLQRKQSRVQASLDEKRAELLEVRGKLDEAKERLARLRKQRVEDAANAILAQRNELARAKGQLLEYQNELASVRDDRRAALGQVHDSR